MTEDKLRASAKDVSAVNDGDTRQRILTLLLEHNPASATLLAKELGLSAAGVRRHIDILLDEGMAEVAPAPTHGPRGRGRPAKSFRLTDRGRAYFGHSYDHLAAAALEALRQAGGEEAVTSFARQRVNDILAGITPVGSDAETKDVVDAVVTAFRNAGYAATINENTGGVQICHHHCPISHVAHNFPQLCAAEHEAVSKLLGQHTQPLATIADGNGICTTNVPLTPIIHKHHKEGADNDTRP